MSWPLSLFDRAQLLLLKIDKEEKKGRDSGGFVIIFTYLIMEKMKQVQALLFPFTDSPWSITRLLVAPGCSSPYWGSGLPSAEQLCPKS